MAMDRTSALVPPAMQRTDLDGANSAFESLCKQAERLAARPTGVGLETPDWIVALEDELEKVTNEVRIGPETLRPCGGRPRHLTLADVEEQLRDWSLGDEDEDEM